MEKRMPWKRVQNYLVIVTLTVLLSIFFAYQNGMLLDGIITYLIIDAVFLAVLLYMLERGRLYLRLGKSGSNRYRGIAVCFSLLCFVVIICYYLPEFTCPAEAFALFLGFTANIEIAISLSSFLCVILCIATGGTFYELAAYCILIFIGAQMSQPISEKRNRIWGCVLLASVSLSIPELFCYLAYTESRINILLWKGCFTAASITLYYFLAKKFYDNAEHDQLRAYEKIIKNDYPLFQDIKNYSKVEYIHAMKVGTVALKCAAEIGANEMLAAAGGFYYRLGVIEGEPYIENGVRLAEEKCFPLDVIQILWEYNGEQMLPSSKESAIVHMVDACVKKIELLSSQKLSSSWNQDMVIYQTLNELSASGIYDESGLSMNQFLKVRELLVREEIGYDNNDRRRN